MFSVYRVRLTVKCSKFSLRSFGAFPNFADFVHVVSRKRLIVEPRGEYLVYIGYF